MAGAPSWRRSGRVSRIDDVFHEVVEVRAVAEAGVVRRRLLLLLLLQRLDEVPFAVHVDHADLRTRAH